MIPVARPWMGEEEAAAARRAILSGWVTQGPEVAAFEREFAEAVGAPHACAVSSCTTALHLALTAIGIGPGDEVITVSHSFIATANAIRYCGATPVFVDVDGTGNIDPDRIEAAISPATRAVLCVHQLGMPCDLPRIMAVAGRHGLRVIEDAACATGSEIRDEDGRWARVGAPRGDVACFSFHPRKLLTTGDGGMLTTRDATLDARFRLLRQHGMDVPDTVRHQSASVVFESYPRLGFNYRMTDIQAAIGREQLKRLPAIVAGRRAIAARYAAALSGVAGITVPHEPAWARSNWQSYAIRVAAPACQRPFMQRLLDEGIATRRGVMNVHREAAYPAGTWREAPGGLATGEQIQDTGVILPLYHDLDEASQARVIEAVIQAVRGAC
ncbi:MAG: DegT/DnrJ/EryC1/StrS family aminotransferase [Vicinamibacterales bacterium]